MKKSTVAIGVVVALGVIWAGGSWYTGKTAEAQYQKQINVVNKQLALLSSSARTDVKIENVKFSRGFFSSAVSYDITIKSQADNTSWVVPFEGKLYHGPLPLDRLAKFDFTPAVLSATSQVVKNEQTKAWFDYAGGKNPAEASATMSYGERVKGNLMLAPGKFAHKGVNVDWTGFALEYDTDRNGKGHYIYDIKQLKAFYDEEGIKAFVAEQDGNHLKSMELNIADVKGDQNLQPTALPNIVVGKGDGHLGTFKVSYTYTEESGVPPIAFAFNGWKYDYSAEEKGGFLDYNMKNAVEGMSLNDRSLGKFDFSMQMNHLSAAAMNRLVVADPNDMKGLEQSGLELLQNQPHFVIKPLSLTNESGKISADLNINLASADFAAAMQSKILSLFKELSFNFTADKAALTNLLVIGERVSGTSKEEAEKWAKTEIEEMVASGVQQQAIVDNGQSISTSLILENNELKFNGNVIPEEHLGMFLLGLMMSQ